MIARRSTFAFRVHCAIAALSFTSLASAGRPPLPPRILPGTTLGEIETRWIAPYIRLHSERVGSQGRRDIRWFNRAGKVIRQVSGSHVEAKNGYIFDFVDGRSIIYGLRDDWKFELPGKAGDPGYITATSDGRMFLHQFHPAEGQIAVDVYIRGKCVSTIGPYLQYRGRDVQPAAKGGLALLAWKDVEQTGAQVIVVGSDGKLRFRVDCHPQVDDPIVTPDGKGVLLRMNAGEGTENTFLFYRAMGRVARIEVGPNGLFTAWVPESDHALFSTSIGHKYRYRLVNYVTGKPIWNIAEPVKPYPNVCCSAMVVGDYLLIGGIEYAAVALSNGRVVARWVPDEPHRHQTWLARQGERLFVMSKDRFSEFSIDDIVAKKNGWR